MREFLKKNLLWLVLVPTGVILDQITKFIARKELVGRVITIIQDWFYLLLTYNEGAAWSSLSGQRWLLSAISIIACVAIAIYYFKAKLHPATKVGLVMVFTGAFGNMIDRLFIGKVTDFIDFNFFKLFNSTFPVFNIADMFITCGAAVLIICYIFFEKDEKKKENIKHDE